MDLLDLISDTSTGILPAKNIPIYNSMFFSMKPIVNHHGDGFPLEGIFKKAVLRAFC